MSAKISSLNLNDDGEMYTGLGQPTPPSNEPSRAPQNNNAATAFVPDAMEKNIASSQSAPAAMMDSTPINELMLNGEDASGILQPPAIQNDPRMQSMLMQAPPQTQMGVAAQPPTEVKPESKNAFNLTDDQLTSLIVVACCAAAVSKPVQDFLSQKVPKFVNDQGSRSAVGLLATGAVAGLAFHFAKQQIIK